MDNDLPVSLKEMIQKEKQSKLTQELNEKELQKYVYLPS